MKLYTGKALLPLAIILLVCSPVILGIAVLVRSRLKRKEGDARLMTEDSVESGFHGALL